MIKVGRFKNCNASASAFIFQNTSQLYHGPVRGFFILFFVFFLFLFRMDGISTPISSYLPMIAFIVQNCPSNNTEWMKASERLNCSSINNTLVYHCVPNENVSSLVEFCYNTKRIGVPKGNAILIVFTFYCYIWYFSNITRCSLRYCTDTVT